MTLRSSALVLIPMWPISETNAAAMCGETICKPRGSAMPPGWVRVGLSRPSGGTKPATAACRAYLKTRETAVKMVMKIAGNILAGAAALTLIGSAALAQQDLSGMITKIDRINGTITIQRTQSGTVGAATGGSAEEFKAQGGVSLDAVHAGDNVAFSIVETGGTKTITKLQKQ